MLEQDAEEVAAELDLSRSLTSSASGRLSRHSALCAVLCASVRARAVLKKSCCCSLFHLVLSLTALISGLLWARQRCLAPLRSLCSALCVSESLCCAQEELLLLLLLLRSPGSEPECSELLLLLRSPGSEPECSDQRSPQDTAVLPAACTAEAPQHPCALAEGNVPYVRRVLPAYLSLCLHDSLSSATAPLRSMPNCVSHTIKGLRGLQREGSRFSARGTVLCCHCMSCALQAQLRARDALTAECSTSYCSSNRPSALPCKRSAGCKGRGISSRPRLSRAQRSSGDKQPSATAAAQSLVQLQPRPQAGLSEGPSLPNFWQDSQDLAEDSAQAPDALPKLLRLNLDLLLVC